ncbi:hypothetical protein QBC45DRAFT_433854 [Copromyces sp. CBS 386.78]|nr:hypothetical protein QBC45DRAFT_433854 [Copromyces sp. CBS 386.78]
MWDCQESNLGPLGSLRRPQETQAQKPKTPCSFPLTRGNVVRRSLPEENGQKQIFDIHNAIRAYAVDIIAEYAYGTANCWNQLDQLADAGDYQEAIRVVQLLFPWFQTFPG